MMSFWVCDPQQKSAQWSRPILPILSNGLFIRRKSRVLPAALHLYGPTKAWYLQAGRSEAATRLVEHDYF